MNKILTLLALALLVICCGSQLRSLKESQHWLKEARRNLADLNTEAAVQNFRRAISWRSPFNSAAYQALDELKQIGFDQSNSIELRLDALRELQAGLGSSRNLINTELLLFSADQNAKLILEQSEEEIARLAPVPEDALRPVHPSPINFSLQLATQFAFWLWVLGTFWFIKSALDRTGRLRSKAHLKIASIPLFGFLCWLILLKSA